MSYAMDNQMQDADNYLMNNDLDAKITVVGVGGGGGNAVAHMQQSPYLEKVNFLYLNTDAQALNALNNLNNSQTPIRLQLGKELTRGLGAGANPEIGRRSAEEDRDEIRQLLAGSDMVFIAAGMGGGTGTGAAPVVAEIAKELQILTVGVVTKPFGFEGKQRQRIAEEGIQALAQHVDSLITIPNDKLLTVLGKNISLLNAFKAANDVLLGAVQGISDLITRPGLINVDFADVRTVMSEMGMAVMGTGVARGENRARLAAEAAIASPLLEDSNHLSGLSGARGILVNITAGLDMSIGEFEEVGEVVKTFMADGATVVVGTVVDPSMVDEMKVTVVVTGLGNQHDRAGARYARRRTTPELGAEYANVNFRGNSNLSATKENINQPRSLLTQQRTNNELENDFDYLDIPAFLRRQEEIEN